MKKTILIVCLLSLVLLTGCFRYGKGETTGYIYAVENGFFWDKVYLKSSLESSETDCYLVEKNSDLSNLLKAKTIGRNLINLKYDRHLVTLANDCYNDEITLISP